MSEEKGKGVVLDSNKNIKANTFSVFGCLGKCICTKLCHVCECEFMYAYRRYISCYNISRTQEQKSINKNIISFFYLLSLYSLDLRYHNCVYMFYLLICLQYFNDLALQM